MGEAEIVVGISVSGNAQTGPWKHVILYSAQFLQQSKENIVELADGFIYVTKPYVGEVHQARSTVQCQSQILDDDLLEVLVHQAHFNIYKVKVQVHQSNTTIKRLSQSLNEDIMEEMVHGYTYSTVLNKRKVHQAIDTRTCFTEDTAEVNYQFSETCRIRSLQGGKLRRLEQFMTPDFLSANLTHLSTFRTRHLAVSRAEILLDDLLTLPCPLSITSETIKVFSMAEELRAYDDNGRSPRNQIQRLKLALVQVSFPASQQLCQAHFPWVILEILETTAASLEESPAQFNSSAQPQGGPAQGLVPVPARGLTLALPGLELYMKLYLNPGWRRLFEPFILLS